MSQNQFKRTPAAMLVSSAVNQISRDASGDQGIMDQENFNWDDLNKLKEELGNSILDFCGQVNAMAKNPEVVNNLGSKRDHFFKLVQLFFQDVQNFSSKVADLRVQHEHLSGHVSDLDGYNAYNRIAITYHSLYTELSTLVSPTLSDLVLTVSEISKPATGGVGGTGEQSQEQEVK